MDTLQGSRSKTRRIPTLSASVGNMKYKAVVSVLSALICLFMVQTLSALGCEKTSLIYILFAG